MTKAQHLLKTNSINIYVQIFAVRYIKQIGKQILLTYYNYNLEYQIL